MKYGMMAFVLLLALPACCLRKNGKQPRKMTTTRVPMQEMPMVDEEMAIQDETMMTEPMMDQMVPMQDQPMDPMMSGIDMEMVEEEVQ
jgi:hypothetical protein